MICLFRHLRSIQVLSEPLRDHLEDILKEKQLLRKSFLLKAGQTCGNIYFIEKGMLRRYYLKGNKEISSGFIKEGDFCLAGKSFFTQQPGVENIQAVENSILYYLTYAELHQIYKDFVEFNAIGRVILERCIVAQLQRQEAFWMQPARDRYHWLMIQSPELSQRVPAKYLASYIGITEAMLSRIKNER